MNWIPTWTEVLGLLAVLLLGLNLWQFVGHERIRRVARQAIEKAIRDKNDRCWIARNQLIELFGWTKVYDLQQPSSEFKGKPNYRHPATMSPAKRRKLGG